MKKVILFLILLFLLGCVHYKYEAREELDKYEIDSSMLSTYDLAIGIHFKDQTTKTASEFIKGDLALEVSNWFVERLEKKNHFKTVANLNANKTEEVDIILKGIIESIRLKEPGISGASKALAILYGVAPIVEHYGDAKTVDSYATIKYQIIDSKSYKLLWNTSITERVRDEIRRPESAKLVFASIVKTAEVLLTETAFPQELDNICQEKSHAIMAAQKEAREPTEQATFMQKYTVSRQWAVIIGISDYEDSRIPPLRYAANDAQSFCNWVTSPKGGRYPPSQVKLLVNEDATGRNIKEALYVWLKQALPEDIVTIFFAGHGSPESPDSPDNLFLLPYDSQYDNLAITGFPMWDIETALKRFIEAKKVVVIADACHAGGVGKAFDIARRNSRAIKVNPISSRLQSLCMIGDGIAVISASDDKQFSQESEKWGDGHGVFTYFLLQGLKGEADYNKDARVTLGELIPYLSEHVRRATKNAQCPTVAGKFDPALSIGR